MKCLFVRFNPVRSAAAPCRLFINRDLKATDDLHRVAANRSSPAELVVTPVRRIHRLGAISSMESPSAGQSICTLLPSRRSRHSLARIGVRCGCGFLKTIANLWSGIFCTPFKLAAQSRAKGRFGAGAQQLRLPHPLVARIIAASDTQPPHLVLQGCSFESEALRSTAITSYLS